MYQQVNHHHDCKYPSRGNFTEVNMILYQNNQNNSQITYISGSNIGGFSYTRELSEC